MFGHFDKEKRWIGWDKGFVHSIDILERRIVISVTGWSKICASILLLQSALFRCCNSPRSTSAFNPIHSVHPIADNWLVVLMENQCKSRFTKTTKNHWIKKTYWKFLFFGLNKKIFFAWIEWTWKMIKYKYILIEYKYIWAILKKVRHCMSQTFKYHSIHEGLEQSFNFISGLVTPHKNVFWNLIHKTPPRQHIPFDCIFSKSAYFDVRKTNVAGFSFHREERQRFQSQYCFQQFIHPFL